MIKQFQQLLLTINNLQTYLKGQNITGELEISGGFDSPPILCLDGRVTIKEVIWQSMYYVHGQA